MSAATTVWRNDLRNILRDRTVGVLLFVPLIFLVLLRFGYPLIERQVPDAHDYRALLLAAFCLIAGTFPAFMTSFIMLDEKDAGLFAALRVVPVSPALLLSYRLVVVAALSFCYPLLLILASGMIDRPFPVVLILALLCALGSPAATLLVVAVAGNKIVGLTMFKALFFALVFVGVGVGLSGWWTVLAVVPTFWIYTAFNEADTSEFLWSATIAVVLHVAVIGFAYRRFRRRVF